MSVDEYFIEARQLIEQGRYNEAIFVLEKIADESDKAGLWIARIKDLQATAASASKLQKQKTSYEHCEILVRRLPLGGCLTLFFRGFRYQFWARAESDFRVSHNALCDIVGQAKAGVPEDA